MNVHAVDSAGQNNWSTVYQQQYKPVVKANNVDRNVMPDVRNMTLKDALYLLENMNLKVAVKGRGRVVAQDIPAGMTIGKNKP